MSDIIKPFPDQKRPDPLTDKRLVLIPPPDPDIHISRKSQRQLLLSNQHKNIAWDILAGLAAWGHMTTEQIERMYLNFFSSKNIIDTLNMLHESGAIRKHTDCPTCQEITIWGLRPSKFLTKIISLAPEARKTAFFGQPTLNVQSLASFCSPPKIAKHDIAATEIACRLADFMEEGWILGSRDARCSSLLRYTPPETNTTRWERIADVRNLERWGDVLYIRKRDGLRVCVEVTVTQNKTQLANKARWWGVSIAERGGPQAAGLYVVLLDPPGKSVVQDGLKKAFPAEASWDSDYREVAFESVLLAKWEEWIFGEKTPASANGLLAYRNNIRGKPDSVRIADLAGSGKKWVAGVENAIESKHLKGVFHAEGRTS